MSYKWFSTYLKLKNVITSILIDLIEVKSYHLTIVIGLN